MSQQNHMLEAEKMGLLGLGRTNPNPPVGCVIVDEKNNEILGRGAHLKAGENHAEVEAILDAQKRGNSQKLSGATAFVTLEPCHHEGQTPPCTGALMRAGIKKVIYGESDPNKVAQGGALSLQHQGVLVEKCELSSLGKLSLAPFLKTTKTGLPLVTLKMGLSLDGKVAAARGQRTQITGAESQKRVHEFRNTVDGIIIGAETVRVDDPSLTVRVDSKTLIPDKPYVRAIFSQSGDFLVKNTQLFSNTQAQYPLWVFSKGENDSEADKVGFCWRKLPKLDAKSDKNATSLRGALEILSNEASCQHLLLEGGPKLAKAFLSEGLVDRVMFFISPKVIGSDGVDGLLQPLDLSQLKDTIWEPCGSDVCFQATVKNSFLGNL